MRVLNFKDIKHIPQGAVYIGRYNPHYGLPESKWHNLYKIGGTYILDKGSGTETVVGPLTREQSIRLYETRIQALIYNGKLDISELTDATALVCWCAPLPCHGDILASLVAEATVTPDIRDKTQ